MRVIWSLHLGLVMKESGQLQHSRRRDSLSAAGALFFLSWLFLSLLASPAHSDVCTPEKWTLSGKGWATSSGSLLSVRAGFVVFSVPRDRVHTLIHANDMLIIHMRNGAFITHRVLAPGTLASLTRGQSNPEETARILLGIGDPSPASMSRSWESCPDATYRKRIGEGVLYSRTGINRAGLRVILILDGRQVHYLDTTLPLPDFMRLIRSFRPVSPEGEES